MEILRRWDVPLHGADFTENKGFVVHPGDGRSPVMLPYPHGTAVSMGHHVLVDRLRQAAADHPGITFLLGERVTTATENGPAITTAGTFHTRMVVGADGRASLVRRAVRRGEPSALTLSSTAGFELTGARLPVEGYGHIFLGGPGPTLAYRIGPDTVRLSLDVAPRRMSPPDMLRHLQRCYAPALPEERRHAFLESTNRQPRPRWAINRFRRRLFYGHGRLALIGDAVGFGHPLAAQGMATAILDAECLARRHDVASYARERRVRSWAPERLGLALHRALTDPGSFALRESLFHLWTDNTAVRDRMMRQLALQEDSRTEFGRTVARIAAVSLSRIGEPDPQRSAIARRGHASLYLANWLLWLLSSDLATPDATAQPTQECCKHSEGMRLTGDGV
ncbi:FAD-dependent monooxygenase [Streptomyces sp. NPDC048527]|uniref:FAD-dependent monooxygenase n=1 Tax=Streptomyces sp. NPDC048527 TaxID=3365568 RepID=UPI003720DC2D